MLALLVSGWILGLAAGGSIDLGLSHRVHSSAPSLDGSGFQSLDGFHSGLGLDGVAGYVAAVGDLNSDKYNDLFVVDDTRSGLQLWLWVQDNWQFELQESQLSGKVEIGYVSPADYDADGRMDVLLGGVDQNGQNWLHLHLGSDAGLQQGYTSLPAASSLLTRLEPAALDLTGDMRMDLFGQTADGRAMWPGADGGFADVPITMAGSSSVSTFGCAGTDSPLYDCYREGGVPPLSTGTGGMAMAVADVDGDCISDLVLLADTSGCSDAPLALEVWLSGGSSGLSLTRVYSVPAGVQQLAAQDMDRDGDLDLVLLTNTSLIMMYNHQMAMCTSQWILESDSCRPQQQLCRADPSFELSTADCSSSVEVPIHSVSGTRPDSLTLMGCAPFSSGQARVRFGDYDLDGFPDLLVPLNGSTGPQLQLWRNLHRDRNSASLFAKVSEPALDHLEGGMCAAFLDLGDDMLLDILLSKTVAGGSPRVGFLYHNDNYDAFAVKMLSGNGQCPEWCEEGDKFPIPKPYGVNFPGATWKVTVVDPHGDKRVQIVPQMQSGSLGMALESAATLVGLGRTNNYLEEVYLGVPSGKSKIWTNLVPNSQLVGFPYKPDEPDTPWLLELYVPSDTKILTVVLALVLILVFLLVPIVYLYWRERQEDKREKLEAQHLFSYDAL